MKDIKVEELLKRFMAGETSVEEETSLAGHFRDATDDDRPLGISKEDWEAYREMFRMFDDGNIGVRVSHQHMKEQDGRLNAHVPTVPRIYIAAAAAVAAIFVLVCMFNVGGGQGAPVMAEVESVDTIKSTTVPIDTMRDDSMKTTPFPAQKATPKKQRRLPYTPSVPKRLIAQAAAANGISEDSMAVALEETERLINAMTVYQELKISEICNVEYEEVY